MVFDQDLIAATQRLMHDLTGRRISVGEAHECLANMSGFLSVLMEWERASTKNEQTSGQGTQGDQSDEAQKD